MLSSFNEYGMGTVYCALIQYVHCTTAVHSPAMEKESSLKFTTFIFSSSDYFTSYITLTPHWLWQMAVPGSASGLLLLKGSLSFSLSPSAFLIGGVFLNLKPQVYIFDHL